MEKFIVKTKPAPAVTKAGLKEYILELIVDGDLVRQTFYFIILWFITEGSMF